MRSCFLRLFRFFVIATLCVAVALPGPAFALRPPQRESASGAEELASQFAPQAGMEEGKISVYLDPVIKDGIMEGNPSSFLVTSKTGKNIWRHLEGLHPKQVVFSNVGAYVRSGSTQFSLFSKRYNTNQSFRPNKPLRLLVVLDAEEKLVTAAYDMETGERVYPEDLMEVYANPRIKAGKLVSGQSPFKRIRIMHAGFWKEAVLSGASTVAIDSLPTGNTNGRASFIIGRHDHYITKRPYEPLNPLRVLVLVDPRTRLPLDAFDSVSGEAVYSAGESIQIYLDPIIKEGRLAKDSKPFSVLLRSPKRRIWDAKETKNAETIALSNIPTFPKNGVANFHLAGESYRTLLPYDKENPPRLLVIARPKIRMPVAAYEIKTERLAYSIEDMVRLYLDPRIQEGQLEKNTEPYRAMYILQPSIWKDPRVLGVKTFAIDNVPTYSSSGRATFSMSRDQPHLPTSRLFDKDHPLRLLVVVDVEGKSPTAAYDMVSGEKVFPSLEAIQVYGGGDVVRGGLVGGKLIWKGSQVKKSSFWDDERLGRFSHVILENVPSNLQEAWALFHWNGKPYSLGRPADPENLPRLWLKVSYPDGEVLGAWDMATGKQVYPRSKAPADGRLSALTDLAEEGTQAGAEELASQFAPQAGAEEDKVAVYLDPKIEKGKIAGNQSPIFRRSNVGARLLRSPDVQAAKVVAFEGMKPVQERGERAAFYVAGTRYGLGQPFDEGLRLLILVDRETQMPLAVYDRATGKKLYNPEDQVQVYLDPALREGRMEGEPVLYRLVQFLQPSFWEAPDVSKAKQVVLKNVLTYFNLEKSNELFAVAGNKYVTKRKPGPQPKAGKLLIVMDVETRSVAEAYDLETAELVYKADSSDPVRVYLDPRIEKGRLAGDPEVFRSLRPLRSTLWSEPEVQRANVLVLENVKTERERGNSSFFRLRDKDYMTTRKPDPDLRLLIEVDPRRELPLRAYDLATGEKVYDLDDQILVYLDPPMEEGRLKGNPPVERSGQKIHPSLFKSARAQSAQKIVFSNVKTYRAPVTGKAVFSMLGQKFYLDRAYDPFLRLLVVVDPKTKLATVAYDSKSGEELYSPPRELITVYANPRLEKGKLTGNPPEVSSLLMVRSTVWDEAVLQGAETVGFSGIPTTDQRGSASFSFDLNRYYTTRAFDPGHPLKLFVVAEPKTRRPVAAYDLDTGEQVYPLEQKIEVYLDPEIKEGRLAGDSKRFVVVTRGASTFWKLADVARATTVVLSGLPTTRSHNQVIFSLKKERFHTSLRYDPQNRVQLLVVLDRATRQPIAAYDMKTGQQVYPVKQLPQADDRLGALADLAEEGTQAGVEEISVYLDPKIRNGKLTGKPAPFRVVRVVSQDLWKEAKVQGASQVVFSNVAATRGPGSRAVFHVASRVFHTKRRYDSQNLFRLLVVADPRTKLPLAAYDQKTGERLDSLEEAFRVYLDPRIDGGRIADGQEPFDVVWNFLHSFWKKPEVLGVGAVALANVPVRSRRSLKSFFYAAKEYHLTSRRSGRAELSGRLLVLLNAKTRLPVTAYDELSGEMVYSVADQIQIYLDPLVENGKLAGDPQPYRMYPKVMRSFWKDPKLKSVSVVALSNVPTFNAGGLSYFTVARVVYSTGQKFDPDRLLRLLVLVNPVDQSPVAAYELETGREVFSEQELIHTYLNPKIKKGRLVAPAKLFRSDKYIRSPLWKAVAKEGAATVALDNVLTSGQKNHAASFILLGEKYGTNQLADPQHPLRLLVVVSMRREGPVPTAAYDMSTGQQVYPPSDLIRVFLNPVVREGFLVNPKMYRTLRLIRRNFWDTPKVQRAASVAFSGIPVSKSSKRAAFFLGKKPYPTTRSYASDPFLKLLVLADPASKTPTAAYDEATGQQVYPVARESKLRFYRDPRIEKGLLLEEQEPFLESDMVPQGLGELPQLKGAQTVAIAGTTTHRQGHGKRTQFWLGRIYVTNRKFDPEQPLRLLVVVDLPGMDVRVAYDLETGERVYPQSADERLSALTDLADAEEAPRPTGIDPRLSSLSDLVEDGTQAGAEEISLYLNSRIEDGRRIGGGEPFYAGRYITGDVWDKPEVRRAKTVVLENVPGVKQGDKFAFNLAAELYLTDLSFNPGKDLRLRILVDSETKLPSEAWDQATGEKVYSAEDLLGVYLDPVLQGGRLAGDARPFRNLRVIPAGIWDDPAVKTAKRIGIANYPMSRKRGIPRITLARQTYKIEGSFDPNKPPKLFVLIDPKLKRVLAIYDMDTGERLLSKEAIGLYLNPVIENGLLAADSQPFMGLVMGKLTDVFKRKEIQAASAIAFHNFPTRPKKGMAYFNIGGVSYPTGERYAPQSPLRLLVLLDPKSQVPTEAYDLTTGKLLFAGKDYVRIYVDPFIEEGRIKAGAVPDLLVREPRGSLWQRPELRLARKTVGLLGISTYPQRDVAGFNFLDLRYRTTLAYSEKNPPKLLVLVDIQSKLPAEAYDLETGKKVFSAADHIQVFLNPKIENGRLAKGAVPFRLAQRVYNSLRKEIERERPKTVALTNVPTREGPNGAEFSMLGRTYLTSRSINTGAPLRLSVLISVRNWDEPVAAYDMATGEQVYPTEEMLAAYLDPEMKNGQVVGGQKLFLRRRQLRSVMWDRASEKGAQFLVVENVKTHNKNGRTVFHLIEEIDLLTSRKFNPRVSLKLVAVGSVKDRRVIAAYDMATGEQVYPASPQPADERLGALADLADAEEAPRPREGDPRLGALADLAEEGTQAGAEELVGRVVRRWEAEGRVDAVVLSSSLLNQPYAEGLKAALRNLPPELAKRVYLAGNWEGLKGANRHLNVIANGSPDDVAVAVGQQVPAPEKVWLVGEFAPVYGWMFKQMGMDPEAVISGSDIQEFLSQLGILLGVPEAQVQSGVEELRQAEQAVEAQA